MDLQDAADRAKCTITAEAEVGQKHENGRSGSPDRHVLAGW
jgi:hypothetical protein